MADFNGFENNFDQVNVAEEDPAAEFLAREQDQLAGIEDETFNLPAEEPVIEGGFNQFTNGQEFEEPQLNGIEEPPAAPLTPPKPLVREEPEKIKMWREEQRLRLEQKDAEEEIKKQELHESAKKELEEWYRHHAEQVEKTKSQNRNAEKEYVMERDSEVPGQEWERIARLCDFNPKTSKNTKDVSRMRSIILQLKQNPPIRS